jgi:nicotinic acid phosphoribosyltransferase
MPIPPELFSFPLHRIPLHTFIIAQPFDVHLRSPSMPTWLLLVTNYTTDKGFGVVDWGHRAAGEWNTSSTVTHTIHGTYFRGLSTVTSISYVGNSSFLTLHATSLKTSMRDSMKININFDIVQTAGNTKEQHFAYTTFAHILQFSDDSGLTLL